MKTHKEFLNEEAMLKDKGFKKALDAYIKNNAVDDLIIGFGKKTKNKYDIAEAEEEQYLFNGVMKELKKYT